MSKLQKVISSESVTKILKYYSDNWEDIQYDFNEIYYKGIEKKDVQFLSKETWLNEFDSVKKMKLFHLTLKTITMMIFKGYLEVKKIYIPDKIYNEIFPLYNHINNIKEIEHMKDRIIKLNFEEMKTALKEMYVDLSCLVSRKSSGTEFTPQSIVRFMFDSLGYHGNSIEERKLLEPACGSGIFLAEAINRILGNKEVEFSYVSELLLNRKAIIGYDINPVNVFITKIVLTLEIIDYVDEIKHDEILEVHSKLPIYCENALNLTDEEYDYVIGNPPYIRLQNLPLEERKHIKKNFNSATGRYDLYVCFIEKAINMLKIGGKLSFITSNKYLTANYGKGIRNYIIENLEVDYIFDLNDTKYFEAAVLPAIITGSRKEQLDNSNVSYFHIKQDNANNKTYKTKNVFDLILLKNNTEDFIKDYFKLNNGRCELLVEFVYSKEKLPDINKQWNFGSKEDREIKEYIENQDANKLGDIADVCVGIKTTADDVFVKPMTYEFVKLKKFEDDVIYPLVQSRNVSRWNIAWDEMNDKDRYILYPHKVENKSMKAIDLDQYPNVKKYIFENEETLKSREYLMESKTREWYECWVPQHLSKFQQPKIVTSDIVSSNSFALDIQGRLCQGNTFFIILKDNLLIQQYLNKGSYLKYLLGILNSEVMEFYQKSISGSLYSKKYRYTSTNLNRWLIPTITQGNIGLVNEVIEIIDNLYNRNDDIASLEKRLNDIIYNLYNMDVSKIQKIKSFIQTNR